MFTVKTIWTALLTVSMIKIALLMLTVRMIETAQCTVLMFAVNMIETALC